MLFQRQKGKIMPYDSTTPNGNGAPSASRTETNRANAQNSTGPRTEAGKQRSSLNALRHGLTGQTVVLPSDDLVAYQRHCKEFLDEYQPKNKTEILLTQTIADLSWRLNRISAIETNLLTCGIIEQSSSPGIENDQAHTALAMAKAFRDQSQAFANLSMYEHRLSVRFDKTLKQLRETQEQRRCEERSVMPKAARLLKMHQANGVPYNPVDDGFVCSERDIETYMRREERKEQAYAATSHA
jgi:hypothetical protein